MNLRDQLKSSTLASHSRLDRELRDFNPFGDPQRYRIFLSLMLSLHVRCRDSVDHVETEIDLASRERSLEGLIELDLQTIRCDGESAIEHFSTPSAATTTKTPETMWGEAYVMEGSAMGGKMMFRQAESSLPAEYGRAYLRQLSVDAGERWKFFVTALKSNATRELDADLTVNAAQNVFDDAYSIFQRLKTNVKIVHP